MFKRSSFWKIYFPLITMLSAIHHAQAAEINIAAASNFAGPIKMIIADFERKTGHRANLTLGASGRFYAQINHGAPFQVFLSADRLKPAALEASGMGLSRFTYAIGRLALWSANDTLIQGNSKILEKGAFRKIALASPKLAPYGKAAIDVLCALGLKEILSPKFVRGENIAQTYQFVATGNADLGFVSLSQITEKGKLRAGSVWMIPQELHSPIQQDAILLKSAMNNQAAIAFMHYLKSGSARDIIRDFGYLLPTEEE
ncbi:MAG: molybdate ABC transporter substrate-binding protein [Emcibacter sp.]|nr:molybdate ABC transporter substrate-binding protein [Emcibacter sp.]